MANKEKTVVQTKNSYRAIQYSCFGGQILSILTPFITLGIVNFDEWFANNQEGWKVGLGGGLAVAILGIAVFLFTKKEEEKTNITNGYIALIIIWFTIAFIFMLLGSIIDQIATIMFFGGIGLCCAFGLEFVKNNFKTKADTLKEIIEQVNVDNTKEIYRQQMLLKAKNEKLKIKIK